MKNINSKIVELRESKRINQSEMARILGVSRTALYRYETGERIPDMEFIVKFAEYFGVSIDDLVFSDKTPISTIKTPTREQILIEKYNEASNGVRESVDILLKMPK